LKVPSQETMGLEVKEEEGYRRVGVVSAVE
jgi:hypothetical protein